MRVACSLTATRAPWRRTGLSGRSDAGRTLVNDAPPYVCPRCTGRTEATTTTC
jgi:hypothetical protein